MHLHFQYQQLPLLTSHNVLLLSEPGISLLQTLTLINWILLQDYSHLLLKWICLLESVSGRGTGQLGMCGSFCRPRIRLNVFPKHLLSKLFTVEQFIFPACLSRGLCLHFATEEGGECLLVQSYPLCSCSLPLCHCLELWLPFY